MNPLRRTSCKFASLKSFLNQPLQVKGGSLSQLQTASACTRCFVNQRSVLTCATVWHQSHGKRLQHTSTIGGLDGMSTWQKLKWDMGFHGKLRVSKRNLVPAGYNLYICCTDFIDFSEFVREAKVPDTFTSWFLLLQLHMWMVNVKVSQMGKEGILLKENVYRAMWSNVETRLEQFEDLMGSERRGATKNFYSLMLMSVLYYDQGLVGSDKQLANSLWIQLYGMDPNVEADKLELMVEYVRKQVHHHDQLDQYPIMRPGYISFLPLMGNKLDQRKVEADMQRLKA